MNKPTLLLRFLEGSRLTYLAAIFAVIANVALSTMIPMIIKNTIDSVFGSESLSMPVWLANLIEANEGLDFVRQNLWVLLVLLLMLSGLQGLFLFLRVKLSAITSERSSKRMRDRLYSHILRQPFDYHVKAQTGDLIQRSTSDIETAQNFVANQSVEAFSIILQVIFVTAFMLTMSPRYTIITVLLIPLVLILTVRFFKSMMTVFLETDESEGIMSTTLQESLTGVRVVKAFAAQSFEMEKFDQTNKAYRDNIMKIVRLMANFWSSTDFLCMLQFAAVIAAGAYMVATGSLTLGVMVAFITYAGMLIWPIRGLGQMMGFMGQAFVALTRIQEILEHQPESYDEGRQPADLKGHLVFRDVHFGYTKNKPLLNGITFEVAPGTTTAILGATGSGKSSLVHLLLRLYDYQAGSITIDGIELSEISRRWIRKHIGMVLQEPFLFSRSVLDNIRVASPGSDDEAVLNAARTACLDESIESFEQGYETMVGERGVTLSGGQRQRVAIARTLLRKAPVLIFDDSLSAVDTETDAAIRTALRERKEKTTTLIISHRIATLSEADQILVLDRGSIIQSGCHESLIKQEGLYKKIWEMQSKLNEIA